jgi:hypothetical protein
MNPQKYGNVLKLSRNKILYSVLLMSIQLFFQELKYFFDFIYLYIIDNLQAIDDIDDIYNIDETNETDQKNEISETHETHIINEIDR